VPTVTAMTLVAYGATSATMARFRNSPEIMPIVLVHLAIYGGLYALFVGATLHAAFTGSGIGLSGVSVADILLSVGPLGFAWKRVACALRVDRSIT
jgi:apolipoprotein N-acyltransferase